jgi:hypothetical protein
MKRTFLLLSISILLSSACKHERSVDRTSIAVMWKDIDSLVNHSKNFQIYYCDSSWLKRSKHYLDSNFINTNLFKLDYLLADEIEALKSIGIKSTYDFYILDTLKRDSQNDFLLILEKYKDYPPIARTNYYSLILVLISEDTIVSAFHLAEKYQEVLGTCTRSSIILPGNRIISRTISHHCSDCEDEYRYCSWEYSTEFVEYDTLLKRFIPYRKAILRHEEEKIKIN